MLQKNSLKIFPIDYRSLMVRMFVGGLIGLMLIGTFISQTPEPRPEWGKFWWIRPLVIVPIGGAAGGAFNYFISQQTFKRGWVKIVFIVFSLIVFLIGLWLGSVLGLAGTYWD